MMISYGADPEAFFTDNNTVYPAGMVLPQPTLHSMWGNLYVDGAALELQPDPSADYNQVVDNLRDLLKMSISTSEGIPIAIEPVMPIDLKWCEKDKKLAVFGCDPDQSAWGEECKPTQIDASTHPFRYGGCHLHFGLWDDVTYLQTNIIQLSQMLDRTVGLASMVIGNNRDAQRREIYGRPGIYRHQPWGMEYRTPSNCLLQNPEVMKFIFKIAGETILLVKHYGIDKLLVIPDDVLLGALRGDDIQTASNLYSIVANSVGLPPIPDVSETDWKVAWGID